MFKPARWRSEKKTKAVLKLQFQATQVPQLKAKTLTIALVPADVGKPTGSSKAGLLGEVSINFADYAEEAKPSTISLPIRTSKPAQAGNWKPCYQSNKQT